MAIERISSEEDRSGLAGPAMRVVSRSASYWRNVLSRNMELVLIGALLLSLVGLIWLVLKIPADFITGTYDNDPETILRFKRWLIALLVTTFSVWIGAGAAYFFGRENLREAIEGIKAAQRPLPTRLPKKPGSGDSE